MIIYIHKQQGAMRSYKIRKAPTQKSSSNFLSFQYNLQFASIVEASGKF